MSWNRTPALSFQEHERTVIRDFWTALKQFAGRLPFVEDLVAAYYCALDPATPMRVRGVLLARPENKQWLLQLTLLALACSAD
jgi:hypothetical protein